MRDCYDTGVDIVKVEVPPSVARKRSRLIQYVIKLLSERYTAYKVTPAGMKLGRLTFPDQPTSNISARGKHARRGGGKHARRSVSIKGGHGYKLPPLYLPAEDSSFDISDMDRPKAFLDVVYMDGEAVTYNMGQLCFLYCLWAVGYEVYLYDAYGIRSMPIFTLDITELEARGPNLIIPGDMFDIVGIPYHYGQLPDVGNVFNSRIL